MNSRTLIFDSIKSKYFWYSIAIFIGYSIITLSISLRYDNIANIPLSGYDYFYYSVMLFNLPVNTIVPIIGIIAANKLIFTENEKITNVKMLFKKVVLSGFIGGLAIIVAQLILLFVGMLFSNSENIHFNLYGTLAVFFNISIDCFVFIFILNSFIVSFLYCAMSSIISKNAKKNFDAVIYPLIIYNMSIYLPYNIFPILNIFTPQISYDLIGKEIKLENHLLGMALTLIIVTIFFVLKANKLYGKRRRLS